jgi:natural product biosynthesis luciferase-like monooxygenase protein
MVSELNGFNEPNEPNERDDSPGRIAGLRQRRQVAREAMAGWDESEPPVAPAPPAAMDFSIFFFSASRNTTGSPAANGAQTGLYDVEMQLAKLADAAGFQAIWTPERHFESFGSAYPNPSVLSAALAACTSNLQIRAGSVVVTLHHPIRVAEEWALVDNLSNGRVGLAFAKGWHQADFVLDPAAHAGRDQLFWRRIDQIGRLWRGEAVEFPGVDGVVQAVKTYPRPIQPHLPCWVTTSGSPDTWLKAGEFGMNVMGSLTDRAELRANIARYRQARAAHGHDPLSGKVCIMLHTFLGQDNAKVKETVRGPMRDYLKTFLVQKMNHQKARGIDQQVPENALQSLLDMAFDDFFDNKSLLGTPEKCASLVTQLRADGVSEVACLVNFGLDADTIVAGFLHLVQLKNHFQPTIEIEEQGDRLCP